MVVCFPTVVFHRHLVVVVRAVWRGMVYDGSVVEGERVRCRRCGGFEWVVNVSVADFWREKHDGMEAQWGNDGAWWSSLVLN